MSLGHVVSFFRRDEDLSDVAGRYLAEAVLLGGAALVVSTPERIADLERQLGVAGVDLARARSQGRLVVADAAATLERFMLPDGPDADAFDHVVGRLVRSLAHHPGPTHVYGDMVALLWERGDVAGVMALESLWNDLAAHVDFSLLCGYPLDAVSGDEHTGAVDNVCRLHSDVIGHGSRIGVHSAVQHEDERAFRSSYDSAREARRFVVETVRAWGRPELADAAALVVSELAANAVLHAGTDFTVSMGLAGDTVHVSLRDAGELPPRMREAAATAENGRGLGLVASLSRSWGHRLRPDGKVVWAEIGA